MSLAESHAGSGFPGLEERHEKKKLLLALFFLLAVVVGGTLGFVEIEGWTTWDAFYFTLITITTVGYGDQGLSESGRKFATVLLIGGVATASYSFAVILQASIANQLAWKKRMKKRIGRMQGHTIVCGFGRMGRAICEPLAEQGAPVVVLDRDPGHVERAIAAGYHAVEGVATEDADLLDAGVERASHVVAGVDSVAENIVTTMIAKEVNPDVVVIARAEHEGDVRKLRRAGADHIVSPFRRGGGAIVSLITEPQVAAFLDRAAAGGGDDVVLAHISVTDDSPLAGRTLGAYGRTDGTRISFVALERPGEPVRIPPGGGEEMQPGDHLIVAGDPQQIENMRRASRPARAA
jgi:voltage-gated potassium channel